MLHRSLCGSAVSYARLLWKGSGLPLLTLASSFGSFSEHIFRSVKKDLDETFELVDEELLRLKSGWLCFVVDLLADQEKVQHEIAMSSNCLDNAREVLFPLLQAVVAEPIKHLVPCVAEVDTAFKHVLSGSRVLEGVLPDLFTDFEWQAEEGDMRRHFEVSNGKHLG